MQRIKDSFSELDAGDISLIVVVVIGYIVGVSTSFTGAWYDLSLAIILVTFVMTAVYLALARGADNYFERYTSGWAAFAYFAIQMTLAALIIFLLGPGAWLISLPLAALAVEFLSRWWQRGIVYLGMLIGLALPFLKDSRYEEAFYFALTLSPAIVFVVVFTRLVISEQQAREDAEALTAELEKANRQLAGYSTQVEELTRTRERNRLAREIHDNLGHYLTVVNVQIRAAQAIMDSDPEKAQESLQKAQQLTQDGLQAVRQSVAALRESPLGGRSLPDAIKVLVEETESSGIKIDMEVRGDAFDLDPRTELTLYRAAQEGLTNVRKHAHASQVNLALDYSAGSSAALFITDNGVGTAVTSGEGYGLIGIRERVEMLGGQVQFDSAPGEGFTLAVTLPVESQGAVEPANTLEHD